MTVPEHGISGLIAPYHFPVINTTYLESTFPEHHWPMEKSRLAIGHAVRDVFTNREGHNPDNPRTDVRETSRKIHIDVELPGVKTNESLSLVWINTKSLYLKGIVSRPDISLDDKEGLMQVDDGDATYNPGYYDKPVHMPCSERHIGWFARTFTFVVDVDQESLKVQLADGVLVMVIDKVVREHRIRDVKVQGDVSNPNGNYKEVMVQDSKG